MVNPRNSRYSRALLGFTLRILRYSRALWGLNPRNLRYSRALLGLSPRILRYSRALVGLNLRNLRYSRALLGFNLRNLFNLEHSGPPDCLGPDLAADAPPRNVSPKLRKALIWSTFGLRTALARIWRPTPRPETHPQSLEKH